jgi:hypothetical protein
VEQDFPKSQVARHSAKLLGIGEGPPKLPKHYHVVQWVHAYVLVCLRALWRIYVEFVADIDIKILGRGGGGGSPALLSIGVVCICMYLGSCLNWHILSLPCYCCCQGSRVFIATLGLVFHWKVLIWLELKSSQREETTRSMPSMMCFGYNISTMPVED